MADFDILIAKDKQGKDCLVNQDEKLLYFFFPSLMARLPLAETWSDPTNSWANLWSPLTKSDNSPVRVDAPDGRYDKDSFITLSRHRGPSKHLDVWMKVWVPWVPGSDGKPSGADVEIDPHHVYVGLYTYEFDLPVRHYNVNATHKGWKHPPPGFAFGMWHPATDRVESIPYPVRRDRKQGGPVEGGYSAGP